MAEGGTGIEHAAVRAVDESVVDEYRDELTDAGVPTERVDGADPGQEAPESFSEGSGLVRE